MANENEVSTNNHSGASEEAKAARSKQRISPIAASIVAAALIVVIGAGYWFKTSTTKALETKPAMVVVLDSAQLAMTRLDRVKEMDLDKDQVQKEAQDFANELGAILAEYEDSGIIVLNKSVVLSSPKQFDITPLVAQRMGLDLEPKAH